MQLRVQLVQDPLEKVFNLFIYFLLVLLATDKTTDNKVAIKCEPLNMSRPQLRGEGKFLANLDGCKGFTKVLWNGSEMGYNFLAMDLLGQSLDSLFEKNNKKFSLKTVLLLVDQMLTRIEELHEHDYIHRDLKPEVYNIYIYI